MPCHSCYESIADEYYDPRHITSRNFEVATRSYLDLFPSNLPDQGAILDLGSGRGSANRYCGVASKRVIQTDKSLRMLSLEPRESSCSRVVSNALFLPFQNAAFSAIVAFLYDPFNLPELYPELARVLRKNGVFLGTLPHVQWGRVLRSLRGYSADKARLITRAGQAILRDSLLIDATELKKLLEVAGFAAVQTHDVYMPRGTNPISPDLADPAAAFGITPFELPLILAVRARRL